MLDLRRIHPIQRILVSARRTPRRDRALKVLKRKMQREGVFREMRQHRFYEKPSEKKTRRRAEGIRRIRKQARKQAVRDGLIPALRKKPAEGARSGAFAQGRAP
jgi:small subunit ribosomal protein S21